MPGSTASAITLDSIQDEGIDLTIKAIDSGLPSGVYRLPTGNGKTRVGGKIIRIMSDRGYGPWLFNVNRRELARQTVAEFAELGIPTAVEMGQDNQALHAIRRGLNPIAVVASKDTLQDRDRTTRKRLSEWPRDFFKGSIDDECHGAYAKTWDNIYDHFTGIGFRLGLSATPFRYDGKRLYGRKGSPYKKLLYSYKLEESIRNGHAADVIAHQLPTNVDVKDCATTEHGDYSEDALALRIRPAVEVLANAIRQELEKLGITRAILFAPDVGCARAFAQALSGFNFGTCLAVHGDNPKYPMGDAERDEIIGLYKSGEIRVICSCEVLTTGFNDPPTQAVIMVRPTKSLGLFVQMVGRATRICREFDKTVCHVIGFDWKGDDGSVMSTVDLFMEDEDEFVRKAAKRKQREYGPKKSALEIVEEAREEADHERKAKALNLDIKLRKIDYQKITFKPYTAHALLGIDPVTKVAKGIPYEPPSPGQAALLQEYGIKDLKGVSQRDAARMIEAVQTRAFKGLADPDVVARLCRRGIKAEEARQMTEKQAKAELLRPTQGQVNRLYAMGYSRPEVEHMIRTFTWRKNIGRTG